MKLVTEAKMVTYMEKKVEMEWWGNSRISEEGRRMPRNGAYMASYFYLSCFSLASISL